MAWIPYDSYLGALLGDTGSPPQIDHDGDTFKIMIVTSSYTPARATHDYINDASANEVSGTNYTSGGVTLANPATTVSSNTWTWDADDPTTISQSAGGFSNGQILVLYKDTGTPSTSPLVAYHDAGSSFGNVAGDLSITLDINGISTLGSA